MQPTRTLRRGDVESAMAKADHVLQGEMRVGGQEQFYMETQACIAVPKGEDGEMEIFSSTQNPTATQVRCHTVPCVSSVSRPRIIICKVIKDHVKC